MKITFELACLAICCIASRYLICMAGAELRISAAWRISFADSTSARAEMTLDSPVRLLCAAMDSESCRSWLKIMSLTSMLSTAAPQPVARESRDRQNEERQGHRQAIDLERGARRHLGHLLQPRGGVHERGVEPDRDARDQRHQVQHGPPVGPERLVERRLGRRLMGHPLDEVPPDGQSSQPDA